MSDFDHVEAWLTFKSMNQNRADSTVNKYRGYLVKLQNYLAAEHQVDLLQADADMLDHFTGLFMHEQGLSPRSRQALVASVKGFYRYARKKNLIHSDVIKNLEYPRAGRKLPTAASLVTAERLLMAPDISTLKGIRDCAMLSVMMGCALRVSGLVRLNESSLQWTRLDDKERLQIRVIEKGDKERILPAPHQVFLLLRAYLGHPDLPAIDRSLPDGDQVLFVSLNNQRLTADKYHGEARRISPRSIDDMIKHYGRKLGLPDKELHAHALRHLFGAELAEDDHNLRHIQDLMGHSDLNTTAIYTQLAMRRLAKTVDQSNPLAKIRTPVTGLEKILEK